MLHHIARVLRLTQLLALLLVIGMGVTLYGVLGEFDKAARWVEHTHQVIDEIETVRLESLRSGIWLRNFMVAPNAESLQRVRSSADRAVRSADRLLALTQDNSSQYLRLQLLKAELLEVLGHYRSSANIAERDGSAALKAVVAERVNNDSTRELRELLNQAEGIERNLLQSRSEVQSRRFALLKQLLVGGAVVFATVMLWAVRYSGRLLRLGREQVRQLKTDAMHDPLTGLLNRRGLEQHLATMDTETQGGGHHVAILAFDLDGFKPVNDRYGHAAGDRVLQEVAQRLQQQCRDGDVIARVGGDEFIVALRVIHSRQEAVTVAQRIRNRLTAPIEAEAAVVRIGASIGIALQHEDGDDMEALLRCADEQMYTAKKACSVQAGSNAVTLLQTAV